jgi:hypothetical protein
MTTADAATGGRVCCKEPALCTILGRVGLSSGISDSRLVSFFVPSSLTQPTSQPPTGRPPQRHVRRASPSTRPAPEMDLDAPVILRCALINCDDSQTMIVYHPHPARADADFPIQINMHTTFPVFYSVHSVHSVGSVRAEYSRNAVAPESSLPQVLTQSHCPDNVLAPPIGAGGAALARVQLTSSCVRPSCIARYHPSPNGRSIRAQAPDLGRACSSRDGCHPQT